MIYLWSKIDDHFQKQFYSIQIQGSKDLDQKVKYSKHETVFSLFTVNLNFSFKILEFTHWLN
jgi:hypothetical protein